VLRELQEELGLAAGHAIEAPLMVTCTETVGFSAGHTDVSLWYVVRADRRQPLKFDASEFHTARWFSFSDLPLERGEPHLPRFLQKLSRNASTTL
jgi:8-oxo-dGTP pyrophosphatase MutT (NUDIX family)